MAMTTTVEKILAKAAELEAQAAALRLAATVLDEGVLAGKLAAVSTTVEKAIAVRRAQRNGHPAPAPTGRSTKKKKRHGLSLDARNAKRDAILTILRDYGKPMPVAELKDAARAQGISELGGVGSYERAGYISASGKPGKRRLTFRTMPTDAAESR